MVIIRKRILNNWHALRWIRLAMGLFIALQAVQMQSLLVGFLAVILLFQAITNTGCCGSSGCGVKTNNKNLPETDEVSFKEIELPRNTR